MSAEAYRKKLTQTVILSNGAEFKLKTISARHLLKILKTEGLTLKDLNTLKTGSEKFDAVLRIQDKLLTEYVVAPKIVEDTKSEDELGLEEISIKHTAELVAHITGAGTGDLFRPK